MCGRFTLRTPAEAIAQAFGAGEVPPWQDRYNIAPTQMVMAARRLGKEDPCQLVLLRWGLIPPWADEISVGNRMTNARSETVATKPSFRQPFHQRRCLVIADGFYEWKKTGSSRQPYYIRLRREGPFGMAGLWERWEKSGHPIESCTILTTQANELMASIHDRMPVIIPERLQEQWLDPACQDSGELLPLLTSFPAADMLAYRVTSRVNSWRHEEKDCIEPLP